jgi:hypothetical protein
MVRKAVVVQEVDNDWRVRGDFEILERRVYVPDEHAFTHAPRRVVSDRMAVLNHEELTKDCIWIVFV